jgi:hypothetical protein
MALTDPRNFYGLSTVSPYARATGEFYGELRVLENSSLALSAEMIDLQGGSNPYIWTTETGSVSAELSLAFSEYPSFVFELFLGNTPTDTAAQATGSATTLTNVKGTTMVDGGAGIDEVAITSGDSGDLKFGTYIIKATAAQVFDLYFSSDTDIGRGNDGAFLTDALKVVSGISVASTDGIVADWGLTFGKAGTPAFTIGNTATFKIRPPNLKSMDVTVGSQANQTFPEFGAIVMGAKRGVEGGELVEVDIFRAKAAGLPINFARNSFSSAEVTIKCMYDSAKDGVFSLTWVQAS